MVGQYRFKARLSKIGVEVKEVFEQVDKLCTLDLVSEPFQIGLKHGLLFFILYAGFLQIPYVAYCML